MCNRACITICMSKQRIGNFQANLRGNAQRCNVFANAGKIHWFCSTLFLYASFALYIAPVHQKKKFPTLQ